MAEGRHLFWLLAAVTQLVECLPSKQIVTGSSPVSRFMCCSTLVAQWKSTSFTPRGSLVRIQSGVQDCDWSAPDVLQAHRIEPPQAVRSSSPTEGTVYEESGRGGIGRRNTLKMCWGFPVWVQLPPPALCTPVAQLAEHLTFNQGVCGFNPHPAYLLLRSPL